MNKIWKSNLKDKLKRNVFRATVESVLVYGSTTWTMNKAMEKRLDGNYTRMLRAALNKSWESHPTNKELYGDTPKLSKSIKSQRLRFSGHCWRARTELASELLLWTPKHGKTKHTYIEVIIYRNIYIYIIYIHIARTCPCIYL